MPLFLFKQLFQTLTDICIILLNVYSFTRGFCESQANCMYELHKNEQYFFDPETLSHLVSFLAAFNHIGVVCAPMLGQALAKDGRNVTVLDIDERFAKVPGFLTWNIYRPQRLSQEFEIIICDPPFFKVSLSQLFKAIRVLSHHSLDQKLLISYLHRRIDAIIGTFTPFKLEATGFFPSYTSIKKTEKNKIQFFGNLGKEAHEKLRMHV